MNQSKLIYLIIDAANRYYDGSPIMEDSEFDQLIEDLREMNPNHPILTKTGWGHKVIDGSPHLYGEIKGIDNKFKSIDDVKKYVEQEDSDYGWCITPKLDGASVVCYYQDNMLIKCVTRGSGKKDVM